MRRAAHRACLGVYRAGVPLPCFVYHNKRNQMCWVDLPDLFVTLVIQGNQLAEWRNKAICSDINSNLDKLLILFEKIWRPRPESNRGARICSPLRNHSATRPSVKLLPNHLALPWSVPILIQTGLVKPLEANVENFSMGFHDEKTQGCSSRSGGICGRARLPLEKV